MGTHHLKPNENHLFRQGIKAPKGIDEEALRNLYAQRPNRRFLGLPIYHLVAIYYAGLKRYDKAKFVRKKEKAERKLDAKIAATSITNTKRINNLQFRKQRKIDKYNARIENGNLFMQWGEPIAVYDSTLVKTTLDRFGAYLFSEGYFQNKTTTKITKIGRFVSLTYQVSAGSPYMIDSIIYRIQDTTVYKILQQHQKESYIKKNERYREDYLSDERERIDLLLKDNGYYDFSRQYIDFDVDSSSLGNHKVGIILVIRNPAKRGYHKQFVIDSVRFTTDAGVIEPGHHRQTRTYRDIQYHYLHDNYNLKILSQRVALTPSNLYSRTNTFNSQRQLANLDAFKFVNINYDTSGGKFIANIFTSPLDRYEWSNEVGMNVTQGFPGPFYSLNFKKRNIFKGLENLELNGRIGIEGVASVTDQLNVYKSTEAGINSALVFPQFLWPLRGGTQIRLGKYNPKTRLSLGYSFSDRPEYRRSGATLSNTYTWQNKGSTQYSLALTNISLIKSSTTHKFDSILNVLKEQGNYTLARSFQTSLVTSMIFGITWNHNYGTYDRNAVFIRGQIESGGTSLNLIDTAFISKIAQRHLQYFNYLRFNLDFRRFKIINKWVTMAYRINTGIAYSYGIDRSLPYEKFYFAGGSNSVRAWRPRRLGLGSVPPLVSTNQSKDGYFNYQLEKPGEILLEGSLELRSKLAGFINGAIFVDVGNVWTSRKTTQSQDSLSINPDRPYTGNSQFKINSFYREFGVGTGFGLRFDFTFLILRFDIGIKVYDPARDPKDRFVLDQMRIWKPYAKQDTGNDPGRIKEPVIYNFNIGYPF